jgi:integrase
MAIYNRNGKFQVKTRDSNGFWVTRTFTVKRDAQLFENNVVNEKLTGQTVSNAASKVTMDEYFEQWLATVRYQATQGWRDQQKQHYRDYISPVLGPKKVQGINPALISKVLNRMESIGRAEQTQLHVYALMRKMMRDAMELFQLRQNNPVLRTLKPKVPFKEARHLSVEEARLLLRHIEGKDYEIAIWIQLFLGLRVGELQALTWQDVDLQNGIVRIHKAYIRKEKSFRDYPKGRKHHSHRTPIELLEMLRKAKEKATSFFVATSPEGEMISYEWYNRRLHRYCRELGIPVIGTHGLRHSTSELYISHGASADDLRRLFAHSSPSVTDRYLHSRGSQLEKISNSLRLFSKAVE